MSISSFKIFIVFILFTVVGIFISPKLSVKLNPSSTLPSIIVNYSWTNASPFALERDVTSKLEAGFSTLKGIRELSSKSSKGVGYIHLEFDNFTNIDIARFETATLIRQLYKELPEQCSYPTISVNRPTDEETSAFLSYSIKANTTPFNIQEVVTTQIAPTIGAIQGIDKTQVFGANPKEYVLTFNNSLLKTIRITKQTIIQALENHFKKESLGLVSFSNQYMSISLQPNHQKLDWHIPIKKIEGRIIYLDGIAVVKEQEQEAINYYRINGDNAITLNIYADKQANKNLNKAV